MLNKYPSQPFFIQVTDLFMMQLSSWRGSWRRTLIMGVIAPMISIAMFGSFARSSSTEVLMYVFSGNIVLSLMFENQNKMTNKFSYMKASGALYYFATLPIYKVALVIATLLAFLVLSLPSLIVTVLWGTWILNVPLHIHPIVILIIPLIAFPLASIGALIGSVARSMEEAGAMSLLVTLAQISLGPVIIPPSRIPTIMNQFSVISPAAHASSAIQQVLIGPITSQLALNMGFLLGCSVIITILVTRFMQWRYQTTL